MKLIKNAMDKYELEIAGGLGPSAGKVRCRTLRVGDLCRCGEVGGPGARGGCLPPGIPRALLWRSNCCASTHARVWWQRGASLDAVGQGRLSVSRARGLVLPPPPPTYLSPIKACAAPPPPPTLAHTLALPSKPGIPHRRYGVQRNPTQHGGRGDRV